jgi:hypothetical protein
MPTPRLSTLPGVPSALVAVVLIALSLPEHAGAATGRLTITVVDRDTGEPIPCRMHLTTASGKPRKPGDRRIAFWHDHFVVPGKITLTLPLGQYSFEMEKGPEYLNRDGYFLINRFADDAKQVDMHRFVDMSAHDWYSGDLDVRRPLREIPLVMEAEDLHVVPVVTWSNNQNPWLDKSVREPLLIPLGRNRYYHIMAGSYRWTGGQLLLFNMAAPHTRVHAGPDYPSPLDYLNDAGKQTRPWVDVDKPFWWDLPMLVAHHRIDSLQVAHSHLCRKEVIPHEAHGKPRDKLRYPDPWGNAQWSQAIYFHLLNCGLRIPPSAGSGSGKSPNPVGYNRVYVHVEGEFSYPKWWTNLKAGRVTITNGPLLRPEVHGQLPGHVFHGQSGQTLDLEIGLTLSTRESISYLEIIKNGQVEHSIRFEEYAQSGRLPKLEFDGSGWFLVRAVTDLPKTYRFAMTGPYYVEFDDKPRISKRSSQFFLDWVYQRAKQIRAEDPAIARHVLDHHRQARDFWQDLADRANAE